MSPLIQRPPHSETVQYYVARVPKEHRNSLINFLATKKFIPLYTLNPCKYDILKQEREYPVADLEWPKFISLPCHNAMTDYDIDYVIFWVNKYFEKTG